MQTIHNQVSEMSTLWAKMKNEEEYVAFVRFWKKTHDRVIQMILEHKNSRKEVGKVGSHHQAMLAKYAMLARMMYAYRVSGKTRLRNGEFPSSYVKKKIAEMA